MAGAFTINADPARKLIAIELSGFFKADDLGAYDQAVTAAADRLRAAGVDRSEFLSLVDARQIGAQASDLITAYRERFGAPERQPRRNATVVASALFRRQVERIGLSNQRIFEDRQEALAWLMS